MSAAVVLCMFFMYSEIWKVLYGPIMNRLTLPKKHLTVMCTNVINNLTDKETVVINVGKGTQWESHTSVILPNNTLTPEGIRPTISVQTLQHKHSSSIPTVSSFMSLLCTHSSWPTANKTSASGASKVNLHWRHSYYSFLLASCCSSLLWVEMYYKHTFLLPGAFLPLKSHLFVFFLSPQGMLKIMKK